jgi:TnpA family transposase
VRSGTRVIENNWKAILNIVAAAWLGITPPSRSMRKLEAQGNRSRLYQAMQAIGHIEKTIMFLSYAITPSLQREVIRQNTKTEHFNQLQDRVFFGNKGIIKQDDHTDIQIRMLCLRLVAAVIIYYNAAWMQAAVRALRGLGNDIKDVTLSHVWPTITRNINLLGYFLSDDTPELQIPIDDLHDSVHDQVVANKKTDR